MARNASKRGPKQDIQKVNPEKVYEKLELARKLGCYNYFLFLTTAGTQGWDLEKAGSIFHYRESNYIAQNVKASSWSRIGKVSKQKLQDTLGLFVVLFAYQCV